MGSINHYWKAITPKSSNLSINDSQDINGSTTGLYGSYSWYNRLIQGSATRLTRYREYDVMDNDIDISRALDIMAEEIAGSSPKTKLPLEVMLEAGSEQTVPNHVVATLQASLKTWCKIQGWQDRIFNLARGLLKYGDVFFERHKNFNKPYLYIHPKHVTGAIVSEEDITDIRGWYIQQDYKKPFKYWQGSIGSQPVGSSTDTNVKAMDKDSVVRFSLYDEMSDEAPFGVSILRPVYRTFKQKEMLEDSVLIYRITRAPEKRVFYLDVGNTNDHIAARKLELFRNELRQKKIPSRFGGKNQVDSLYNPQSMNEDFFFTVRGDQSSARVETLPGGQGLGELTELDYFYKKIWRGMRLPPSYVGTSTDDDTSIGNETRVGVAYMQEIVFTKFCARIQRHIEVVMDEEFKRWLYSSGIKVDPSIFRITLPEPSDYWKSRQQAMDAEMLNNFGSIEGTEYMSKRFVLERYLGLTKAEIKINERMLRQEKGLNPNGPDRDLPVIYFPEEAETKGFDGGIAGSPGSPFTAGPSGEMGEDIDDEDLGDEGEGGDIGDEDVGDEDIAEPGEEPAEEPAGDETEQTQP